jgi:hypothetical protein
MSQWEIVYVRKVECVKLYNSGAPTIVEEEVVVPIAAAKTAYDAWFQALATGMLPEMPAFGTVTPKLIGPAVVAKKTVTGRAVLSAIIGGREGWLDDLSRAEAVDARAALSIYNKGFDEAGGKDGLDYGRKHVAGLMSVLRAGRSWKSFTKPTAPARVRPATFKKKAKKKVAKKVVKKAKRR